MLELTLHEELIEVEEGDNDEHHRSISSAHSNSHPTVSTRGNTNRNEKLFQKRLTELQDFRSIHGHGSIPTPYTSNPSLGIWAANVRQQYSLYKHAEERGAPYIGYLTPSRRQQLQLAGFEFASLTERQFRTRLRELEMFKKQYGHCMVPEKWEENAALGAWVSNIRSLYKRRVMVQQQRQVQLQHDGEEINREHTDATQSKIGNQKQRRGRRILLQSSSHHSRKKRQRLPRFSHLDEHRIQVLEDMGFVWSSIDRKWLEMLEWAKVYGVVNYAMTLPDAEEVGGEGDPDLEKNTIHANSKYPAQLNKQSRALLLDNYHQFVQNIQNQSLLPCFHPQDKILSLMMEDTYPQSILEQPPLWQPTLSSPPSDENAMDESTSTNLDYRIRRNDKLHQPLRIWMINQRSNYNRLDPTTNQTREKLPLPTPSSTLIPQRQRALEAIYFPWSGRFRTRVEEMKHEQEIMENIERKRERERRIEQKVREEQDRVDQLTSSIVASVSSRNNNGMIDLAEADADIMALWGEEDDDDDGDDGW
ncbi:hypothetical protein ACHAXH_008430 [Discostella pseudostelligera]